MTNHKPLDSAASLDPARRTSAVRNRSRLVAVPYPKNLATALTVEVAELLEHFQWLREGSSTELGPAKLAGVRQELADVLVYLVMLADKLDIDLLQAARDKLEHNAGHTVDKARGSSRKYTER